MRSFHASKGLFLSFLLAALACGGAPEPADTAASPVTSKTPAYLALGDSIPFGYDPTLLPPFAPGPKTLSAFVGYPTYLSAAINEPLTNPSCPGETSGSFLNAIAPDRGCRDFKAAFGLHEPYTGTQLAFALAFLASHPQTQLMTLTLGANDALLLQQTCADEACIGAGLASIGQNVAGALHALRQARPVARIIVTLYYAPSLDPGTLALVQALNSVLAQAAAGRADVVVDLEKAFDAASASFGGDPCAAGLLVRFPDGTCDIHPSQAGQKLIAATIRPKAS